MLAVESLSERVCLTYVQDHAVPISGTHKRAWMHQGGPLQPEIGCFKGRIQDKVCDPQCGA